ncbi:MAG: DUF3696 domain-containing protein [Lachnospiraceae bacterium]|nr:DUF3696 domain-containing protein [Lachnospiraceae bacterium]
MIKEIHVKNFKCFEDFLLPVKNINVLTGINGMGKSTIIQSLLLLRQSFRKNGNMKGLDLNGGYISLGNAKDVLYEKADDDKLGLGFTDETGKYFWEYAYSPESDFMPVLNKCGNINETGIFGSGFSYLSAYRIQPQDLYGIQNEEETKHKEFGNSGKFALQYLDAYGDKEITNKNVVINDKMGNSLRNQVRVWLNMISPGVSPQVTVNMQLRNLELRYEFIEGRNKTEFYKSVNVGFGITYVLPLIIAILSAEKGDIIIIENPEAHIHPAGQRMLGELISCAGAGGVQLIIETHSDHIINGLRLSVKKQAVSPEDIELSFFYKERGYCHMCVHPQILQDGRLDCWPEGFFDEWDKALYEMI